MKKFLKRKEWRTVKFAQNYFKFQNNLLIDKSIRMNFLHKRPCSTNRNLASGYNTLILRLILRDLYSAFPNKQFHTVTSLIYTVRFHYQTHTLKPVCQAGR